MHGGALRYRIGARPPRRRTIVTHRLIPSVALACSMTPAALACPELPGAKHELPNQPGTNADWASAEAPVLTDHVRLTSPERFLKAGEAYFNPDATRIIFQAIEHPPEGEEPSIHYAMYVADLDRDESGAFTGLSNITLVSEPGSSNTCGWFHPTEKGRILFGSTVTPLLEENAPGYQRGTSKYSWQFPNEMEIISTVLPDDLASGDFPEPEPLWVRDGYDAEGSWSSDGRFVLYTRLEASNENAEPNGDLWIYDRVNDTHTALVTEPGYDGGPFFSRDDKRIVYRSDRKLDKHLQLYIGELAFDDTGAVLGLEREIAISDNGHVNWCPYLNKSGDIAFYATSEVGHFNYEVFAIEAGTQGRQDKPVDMRTRVRVTHASGFDGLPVFSPDNDWVMWTSQRAPEGMDAGSFEGTSQLWIARYDEPALRRAMFDASMRRAAGRPIDNN